MNRRKTNTLTPKQQAILNRLEKFALRNNLDLFNVRGSLYQRLETLARNGGKCPCFPDTRPHCPCKECIQECRERGECGCRVFIARK